VDTDAEESDPRIDTNVNHFYTPSFFFVALVDKSSGKALDFRDSESDIPSLSFLIDCDDSPVPFHFVPGALGEYCRPIGPGGANERQIAAIMASTQQPSGVSTPYGVNNKCCAPCKHNHSFFTLRRRYDPK
jgi:hypothetical protein